MSENDTRGVIKTHDVSQSFCEEGVQSTLHDIMSHVDA